MHRIFRKLSISVTESLLNANRGISVSCVLLTSNPVRYSQKKLNPVRYSQNVDLGRHVFQEHAIKTLIENEPLLSATALNDIADGLINNNLLHSKLQDSPLMTCNSSNDVLDRIGELKRGRCKESKENLSQIFEEINKKCLLKLRSSDFDTARKHNHAKFFLKHLCDNENIKIHTKSRSKNGFYLTSVFLDNEFVAKSSNEVKEDSVCMACRSAIEKKFQTQFDALELQNFKDIPLDKEIDIAYASQRVRVVNIIKKPNDEFGFTLRGGQQKVVKNKDYVQKNIITPIIVYDVQEGSPAQNAGLMVGDVVLGVNDHALTKKLHEQAVIAIRKFRKHEEVELTVVQNRKELLKYEAEQQILERELEKTMDDIKNPRFGKWHESKSRLDPMAYFMEKFVDKKVMHQPKKGGNKNRLWHQYKPKQVLRIRRPRSKKKRGPKPDYLNDAEGDM